MSVGGTVQPLAVEGLPRSNGELVFDQPWESRAFGLAAALADLGVFSWNDFRAGLIAEVASDRSEAGEYAYYERWLGALEALLIDRDLISTADIDNRADVLCHRPAGHDHRHDDHDGQAH